MKIFMIFTILVIMLTGCSPSNNPTKSINISTPTNTISNATQTKVNDTGIHSTPINFSLNNSIYTFKIDGLPNEIYPSIEFFEGGLFLFKVNINDNMGKITGSYKVDGSSILLEIKSYNFDNIENFTGSKFIVKNDNELIYSGKTSGKIIDQSIFIKNVETPDQTNKQFDMNGEFISYTSMAEKGNEPKLSLLYNYIFLFNITFSEGKQKFQGIYSIENNIIKCTITERDFTGWSLDNANELIFNIIDDNIIVYKGTKIGITYDGDIFIK